MATRESTAHVLTGTQTLERRRFPLPTLRDNDAVMKVSATGLCGSDVASYLGEKEHDGPVILGHEVVGRISDIGPEAAARWGVRAGDRVAVEEAIPCMSCPECQSGHQRLCTRSAFRYGFTSVNAAPSLWGGFAEYMYLHPQTQLHRVPDAVPDELATLYIPLSNGLSWMRETAQLHPGERVAVFGPGQHGIASALASLRLGAAEVVVVGTEQDESRLAVAREFGCQVVSPALDDAEQAVIEALGGQPDVVMDMTPRAAQPVEMSIRLAAPRGRVLWGGMKRGASQPLVNTDLVAQKELTIRGVWGRPSWAIPAAFKWLASDPGLSRLCERTYDLADLNKAFSDAIGGTSASAPLHAAITVN